MLLNYIREKIVTNIYLFITARMRRVHTPMQQVIMQLKQKGFWHFGGGYRFGNVWCIWTMAYKGLCIRRRKY